MGQLLVSDVKCESGIHYLSITDLDEKAEKKLKTVSSRRKVPLHPELIRIGFLEYVEKMRKRGALYLFPDLRPDRHGRRTGNWGKWWGRYRREQIGITGRLKPFHSTRHSFRDACREAEIDEEIADALMGHEEKDKTGRSYGSGYSLKALYRAICRIEYPGVKIPIIVAKGTGGVVNKD